MFFRAEHADVEGALARALRAEADKMTKAAAIEETLRELAEKRQRTSEAGSRTLYEACGAWLAAEDRLSQLRRANKALDD